MKKSDHLNTKDVADLLQIPVVKVQRWVHQGRIPCKFKGAHYHFKRKEILDWAKAHDLLISEKCESIRESETEDSHSLQSSIEKGGVFFHLGGSDVVEVITQAIEEMTFPSHIDKNQVLNELLSREEIASTGIGRGIAIPHPRSTLDLGQTTAMISLFFLKKPIDYDAVDGEPVSVLFFMFSPSTEVHLKLLSRLSFLLRDSEFLKALKACRTRDDVLTLIEKSEKALMAHVSV